MPMPDTVATAPSFTVNLAKRELFWDILALSYLGGIVLACIVVTFYICCNNYEGSRFDWMCPSFCEDSRKDDPAGSTLLGSGADAGPGSADSSLHASRSAAVL